MRTRTAPRGVRRSKRKRARKRKAAAYFHRVVKLRAQGRSISAIASTTRTSPDLVRDVIAFAEKALKKEASDG